MSYTPSRDVVTSEYIKRVDRTAARAGFLRVAREEVAKYEAMKAEGWDVDEQLERARAQVEAFSKPAP